MDSVQWESLKDIEDGWEVKDVKTLKGTCSFYIQMVSDLNFFLLYDGAKAVHSQL